MPFRAATYNVLATAYIRPDWYVGVPPELLRPGRRVPALVGHVVSLDADLLCLQEVEGETLAALRSALEPLGYEGYFEKKGRGKPDGCATFFRQSAFALREVQRLEYQDEERGPSRHSGHIALLLCLEHRGDLLGVANTHVRWDRPGLSSTEHVGYRQVMELLEVCERFTPTCRGWLICGDFNATADSGVVAAMTAAGYRYAHAGSPHARSRVANERALLIDYLFHSGRLRASAFDPPAVGDDTLLPSEEQPSDHLALVAELDWA
jgi:mRNA deadenylase 3'-5' endonuclease subunit Ccr4